MQPRLRFAASAAFFALALTAVALVCFLPLARYSASAFPLFAASACVSAWFFGRAGGAAAAAMAAALLLFTPPGWPAFSAPTEASAALACAFLPVGLWAAWATATWRESRHMLDSTLSTVGDAVMMTDARGRIAYMNVAAETLTGWPRAEARGKAVGEVARWVGGASREDVENPLSKALRERVTAAAENGGALRSKTGAETPVEYVATPVRDDAGRVRGGILIFRDISRRLQLEEQAAHSQKMDAVGRLASGVAGDFNNVLTVITGYGELLRSRFATAAPERRFVDEIVYAAERAASLTRRLLLFSRGAGAQPRVVDLNGIVTGMEPVLTRLFGPKIELTMVTHPELGKVKADPSQIEQVIVNLASNARDAMPRGGKVVLETANADLPGAAADAGAPPGAYVMLAISDTGVGMDPATRSRVFEPFFTTKAPGQGSGMGLATVYGAVKQMEGYVTVYSQPGSGSIFEIYLPRVKEAAGPKPQAPLKGSETVLLVDDEEGVRKVVKAVLESKGYRVAQADGGAAALELFGQRGGKFDIALLDVVMPQMSGFELGALLEERAPGLKIVYMSGYRDSFFDAPPAGKPRPFMQKPFTPDALLARVRETLDG
jgi:two-component system, cell cycle sensor histidine kinase and response regulator CckA